MLRNKLNYLFLFFLYYLNNDKIILNLLFILLISRKNYNYLKKNIRRYIII